jgi:hypothetical protein
MKCKTCNKPIKENTDGDKRYCQGHDLWEASKYAPKVYTCSVCGTKSNALVHCIPKGGR